MFSSPTVNFHPKVFPFSDKTRDLPFRKLPPHPSLASRPLALNFPSQVSPAPQPRWTAPTFSRDDALRRDNFPRFLFLVIEFSWCGIFLAILHYSALRTRSARFARDSDTMFRSFCSKKRVDKLWRRGRDYVLTFVLRYLHGGEKLSPFYLQRSFGNVINKDCFLDFCNVSLYSFIFYFFFT